jgi:protein-S-isoprenylcysteine O-methyltransferase Ste14
MSISDRWIGLLHGAASGTKKLRTLLTPVGLVIFGVFTGLFVYLSVLMDRWLSLPWPLSSGLSKLIAATLIPIGVGVTAWSVFHFFKVKGTPVPFNPPPKLIMSGPYRFARNPMLTGVFLFLFGIGFAIQSLSLVVLFTPLYILTNIWELKEIEEPELVKRLGEDYVAYRRRTPMFIPGMRLRK